MESWKAFFSNHEDITQLILYALVITSLWLAEIIVSLNGLRHKWKHTVMNSFFIFTALPIQLLLTSFIVLISKWANINHWGLVNYIPFHHNVWVYYISLFILLDLCEYIYHVTMHKVDTLWKFHLVHHSDLRVDVSTTVREHPGETCVRTCCLMLWTFLLGPMVGVLILRQTFQTLSNVAAHTEFRLSGRANKIMGLLFITPNLHHVHHHYRLPYTDCNYGDVLSIWDRLFGTFSQLDSGETVFGIDTHMDENVSGRFLNIIRVPFQKLERKKY